MIISGMVSLAVLSIVGAINIDNELRVIKIDCYERLAIGQRLNSNNVYKSHKYNTVGDCKKVCSEEKTACKAFSFGIAAKGNATCELSATVIKETADLKPVGTRSDVDFDLYIKKSGCTVVSGKSPHIRPTQDDRTKPPTLGNVQPQRGQETAHNVQTLVSVASGPQTVLNPLHGILVAPDENQINGFGSVLPHWYEDYKGQYDTYEQGTYSNNFGIDGSYEETVQFNRPPFPVQYQNVDRNDDDTYFNRYGDKMSTRPYVPKGDYLGYPTPERYGSVIPHPHNYYKRPTHDDYPNPFYRPNNIPQTSEYQYNRPLKPFNEKPVQENFPFNQKPSKPVSLSLIYEIENPKRPETESLFQDPPKKIMGYGSGSSDLQKPVQDNQQYYLKPITTYSTGYNGEQITSIITEIKDACFRRVLAGKRISRGLVRRALNCETVEECQRECADEKVFACEGFNYRLDPSGRAKGDCELLSVPLSRLDVYRDSYPDPDYDYYERDRNAAAINCRQRLPIRNNRPYQGYNDNDGYRHGLRDDYVHDPRDRWSDRRYDYEGHRPLTTYHGSVDYRRGDRWRDDDYYRKPIRPEIDRRYDYGPYDRDNRPNNKRRGDYSYLPYNSHYERNDNRRFSTDHLLPPNPLPYDQKPYETYPPVPPDYHKYQKKYSWGFDNHRYGENYNYNNYRKNFYLPPRTDTSSNSLDWGLYHKFKNNYSYWGADKYGGSYGRPKESYLPPEPALIPPEVGHYLPGPKPFEGNDIFSVPDSALLPVEHRRPTYNNNQDDCSLRSVTGFKLHKRIVTKYFAVPNIYECELLCFKESSFPCSSYAYRYTITVSEPTDNCYLSNLNYKELDHYTDLEPDRDFDIYTMNNKNRCNQPIMERRDNSDCFWRVRSGERLHHKIVRDSLKAKSIVDCQIECITSIKFTCRAFSYRYGPSILGGSIDNCQLTDWPYYELEPRIHFIPEPGFEIYERGSFGHGCETGHFGIRGHIEIPRKQSNPDQLCYIGFGSPARLLPQAIRKSVRVSSDLECKEECSRARLETLFQCMSFSFWSKSPRNVPNCDLSDIYQRDLLAKLDYVYDPNALLFAWDNYNPDCGILANDPVHTNHISGGPTDRDYFPHALDTWRVYSVSGWPCKRDALCKENTRGGFWFCEIEGGESGAWDYCCRPDHQCGASNGYHYLWCYVGPDRTQWRRCNDRYYPYMHDTDRLDDGKYLPPSHSRPWRPPIFRPDRLPVQSPLPPPKPSLDQYEMIFDEEFLEPPKPGGFGQPRHWPVSYLHKEMPPNITDSRLLRMEADDTKYSAIQNLISVIKNNDLKSVQYHITNESNKRDDILFVKIPLPTNFTFEDINTSSSNTSIDLQPVNVEYENNVDTRRFQKSLPLFISTEENNFETKQFPKSLPQFVEWKTKGESTLAPKSSYAEVMKQSPVYRRGFVIRTNVTTHGKHS